MKVFVMQYELLPDGGMVLPTQFRGNVEIVLPQGVDHIVIEKEEIAPKTVYRIYGVDESELKRGGF